MPGRKFNTPEYAYGHGGQLADDEITDNRSHYSAEYWEYDSRLGRRWNVDPVVYPWQSSYATFNNNPIVFNDPKGLFATKKEARKYRRKNRKKDKSARGKIVENENTDGSKYYSIDSRDGTTSTTNDSQFGITKAQGLLLIKIMLPMQLEELFQLCLIILS